jgi:hypothetical protein
MAKSSYVTQIGIMHANVAEWLNDSRWSTLGTGSCPGGLLDDYC